MQRITQRLVLQAATIELATAELSSTQSLETLLQANVPSGWPPGEYDRSAQEFFLDCLKRASDRDVGWYSWYALHGHPGARSLIGAGGFLGPPDESGLVEIGFSIHPNWTGRGFATEMVGELVCRGPSYSPRWVIRFPHLLQC